MAKQTDSIDRFFRLPEVQCLLTIARSDNALIALDVQRREISWTQFMGWLLDPVRVGSELAASRLGPLVQIVMERWPASSASVETLRGHDVEVVHEVVPELIVAGAGRLDLMIRCQIADATVRVLIENKIDAVEHVEQLAGYVAHHAAGSDVVLPILIELGDTPTGKSTCNSAACLNRYDITSWLESITAPPQLVDGYLALFKAWDTAAEVRAYHWRTIERLREVSDPPSAWRLIEGWFVANEMPFYHEVLNDPTLVSVLERHGFDPPDLHGRMKSEHDILKLTKPGWTLYPCRSDQPGVQIHYECDGRGKMRLDIEVYPYEGGITKDPGRVAQLEVQLQIKAELHRRVRAMLRGACLDVDQRRLSPPDTPAANSAGRFISGLGVDCTPAQHAAFVANVICVVTPLIDAIIMLLRQDESTRRESSDG